MQPRFSPDYDASILWQAFVPARPHAVEQLEEAFCQASGHSAAIALQYGRTGLYLLLKALGAKNKKVILPSYTCVVVAHAVIQSGNIPVFLDCAPGRFQPDPMDYLHAIDADTVMVIPTHLFGLAEETAALYQEVKAQYPHVFVLQDCAHSFFCADSTGAVVTQYGDGALFGMNISKLANAVCGGMLTLKNASLAAAIRSVWQLECAESQFNSLPAIAQSVYARAYSAVAALAFTSAGYEAVWALMQRTRLLATQTEYYQPDAIGLPNNFLQPLSPYAAQIGLQLLERLPERVARRRECATYYLECLQNQVDATQVVLPANAPGHTWSHFPVAVLAEKRDTVQQSIQRVCRAEVGVIVDYSVADLPAYQRLGHAACPNARAWVPRMLNLPMTWQEGLLPNRAWQTRARQVVETLARILNGP